MIGEMLKNLDPKHVDEDIVSGLKIMLEHDTFIDYHEQIKIKLDEIQSLKKKSTEKEESSFALKVGSFYETVNGSIVFCSSEKEPLNLMIVLKGGHNDALVKSNIMVQMMHGVTTVGGSYAVDKVGKFTLHMDDDKHPMHIIHEIRVGKIVEKAD